MIRLRTSKANFPAAIKKDSKLFQNPILKKPLRLKWFFVFVTSVSILIGLLKKLKRLKQKIDLTINNETV